MAGKLQLGRREFLIGSVAAVAAASLAGCTSGGGSGTQNIVWSTWGTPQELARARQFNTQFMKTHPNINVTLQPVADCTDYHTKLLTELTSGTAPDVFYIGDDQIGKFVHSKVLLPLNTLMNSKASQTRPDQFPPGLLGAAEQNGKILAEPNDTNPDVFWYDKVALKKAGITDDPATLAAAGQWTTTTFLDMCQKLKAKGMIGTMFWNYWSTHYSWISSQGGQAFDSSGNFVANTDATALAAMDTFGKRFQNGQFVIADTMPTGDGSDAVLSAHGAGFYVQGRYTIATVKTAGDPQNYDIAPWPTPSGKLAPTGVATSYLAINAKTPSQTAAFAFWTAFLSKAGQTYRLKGGGNAVPSIAGAESVVLDGYPAHAQTMLDLLKTGFEDPKTEANVPGLSTQVSAIMLNLYQGKLSAKAALDQTATLIKSKTGK